MVPQPKWLVHSKHFGVFCCLCRKYWHDQHCASEKHQIRLQNVDLWMNVYTQLYHIEAWKESEPPMGEREGDPEAPGVEQGVALFSLSCGTDRWVAYLTKFGLPFYYNLNTGRTQWRRPEGAERGTVLMDTVAEWRTKVVEEQRDE